MSLCVHLCVCLGCFCVYLYESVRLSVCIHQCVPCTLSCSVHLEEECIFSVRIARFISHWSHISRKYHMLMMMPIDNASAQEGSHRGSHGS